MNRYISKHKWSRVKRTGALLAFLFFSISLSSAQNKSADLQQLPEKSQSFIQAHFSNLEVMRVKVKTKRDQVEKYKVKMSGREKIEFDGNGDFYKIDMQCGKVPASLLSSSIKTYVSQHYPDLYITQLKFKKRYDEIELSNGLELEFDKNGRFLRIDD